MSVHPDGEPIPRLRTVAVAGDATVDWNLAAEPVPADQVRGTGAAAQHGGARLLADLVGAVVRTMPSTEGDVRVECASRDDAPLEALNHSWALWTCAQDAGWFLREPLGVDHASSDVGVRAAWSRLEQVAPRADVVVLDDAALGFRDGSDVELWRRVAEAPKPPWVVLKQTASVAAGPLWEHLVATLPDRLVAVLPIEALRGSEVQVSRGLSWERTAQDLLWELVHTPAVNALSRIAHTVVTFGTSGAVHLADGHAGTPDCTLFFDPTAGEQDLRQPRVMGSTDVVTAALVREVVADPRTPDLDRGIQQGEAGARALQTIGYRLEGPGRLAVSFPLEGVVTGMGTGQRLEQIAVSDPAVAPTCWTILEERCTGDLTGTAARLVLEGPERALAGVPLGRFGKLVTADRSEIEAFRGIGGLIGEYVHSRQAKPLSIAVFGPPGAGKSFGVKEVAHAVGGDLVDTPLEFNLAQLRGPDELPDAFHLVRDRALTGRVPLVFWDEFDTALGGEALGWLRYFLAPMQDGAFRQGQLTHPIGRAIFVFAGGTSAHERDFATTMHSDEARRVKGPDFVSRLQGYVDILGPNPQDPQDTFHVVRRAILLRSLLLRSAPALGRNGRLHIDEGVLRAFLRTRVYRHGARSMEAVIAMSQLSGQRTYSRSSLPAGPQLELHVDAEDFLSLVHRPLLEGDLLERLARAAHEVYRGIDEPGAAGVSGAAALAYEQLPEHLREQNRAHVRDIPAKLARLGCVMVPGRADLPPVTLTEEEVEALSQEEHERWMSSLGPGWSFDPVRDRKRKLHEAYLPWDELPEEQREKDRTLVRAVPLIVRQAGFALVRTEQAHAEPGAPDRVDGVRAERGT